MAHNGHFPGMFSLVDKVAIVTGASRGLGRSIAIGLAEAGADVVIADIISGESVTKEIERLGRRSVAVKVDVSSSDEVNEMASETVDRFGHIDILVNNAGIGPRAPAEKLSKPLSPRISSRNCSICLWLDYMPFLSGIQPTN